MQKHATWLKCPMLHNLVLFIFVSGFIKWFKYLKILKMGPYDSWCLVRAPRQSSAQNFLNRALGCLIRLPEELTTQLSVFFLAPWKRILDLDTPQGFSHRSEEVSRHIHRRYLSRRNTSIYLIPIPLGWAYAKTN